MTHRAVQTLLSAKEKIPQFFEAYLDLRPANEQLSPSRLGYITAARLKGLDLVEAPTDEALKFIRKHPEAQLAGLLAEWSRNLVVYRFDRDLVMEFSNALDDDDSDDIPADILEHLPSRTLCLDLQLGPAHKIEPTTLWVNWCAPESTLTVYGPHLFPVPIPLIMRGPSIDDAITQGLADTLSHTDAFTHLEDDDLRDRVEATRLKTSAAFRMAGRCLAYLTSSASDLEHRTSVPREPTPPRQWGRHLRPQVIECGTRVGAAIRAGRRALVEIDAWIDRERGEGRTHPRPHWRCGHFRGVRVGPRPRCESDPPQRREVRWIEGQLVSVPDGFDLNLLEAAIRPVKT